MIKNIKTTSIELTPAIEHYLQDKLAMLEKVLPLDNPADALANIEIGRTSEHHKTGLDIYRAEINLSYQGKMLRCEVENADLYLAIDGVKDKMVQEVRREQKKKNSLLRRGGRIIKKLWSRT